MIFIFSHRIILPPQNFEVNQNISEIEQKCESTQQLMIVKKYKHGNELDESHWLIKDGGIT